ncbi:hypothetical protein GCM10007167_23310 [Vulcaniibacterium thermophilum]|uniref:Uncharacterized protein n=1 Tax=Vulcaniibacterium thermophilum TaxID=1169913 RepID=A0A919DGA3_9GAMM|nr:hypothetical protein GCM10007167_23310 [Vulcaniibacterium thermophilum]
MHAGRPDLWLHANHDSPIPIPQPQPGSQFPVPDSRFPVPGSRFPVPGSQFPVPSSQFPVPSSQFPIPDSRFPTPDSRLPIPDSRFPIPDSRFPIPAPNKKPRRQGGPAGLGGARPGEGVFAPLGITPGEGRDRATDVASVEAYLTIGDIDGS